MKIFVGTDHAGYIFKEKLISFLRAQSYEVVDKGAFGYNEEDDFPDFVIPVSREVSLDPDNARGIILGATGEAEAIAANKFPHTRAIVFYGKPESVVDDQADVIVRSREHSDANILILGARYLTEESMMSAVTTWLHTSFGNEEKYVRRLAKIDVIKI